MVNLDNEYEALQIMIAAIILLLTRIQPITQGIIKI